LAEGIASLPISWRNRLGCLGLHAESIKFGGAPLDGRTARNFPDFERGNQVAISNAQAV